ncbi:amidase [Bradyrhizobium sp. USDA 4502]
MKQFHELSAWDLAEGYRQGSFSPVDITQAIIERVGRYDPLVRATYAFDPEAAIAMAKASEARWRAGRPLMCGDVTLDGIPVTIKENIATRGVPVPLGTNATDLKPATADAPPAARLREAGSVFITKTTMPEYGMLSSGLSSFHPLTRNPWNLAMNPGGSSAGAGAAAAAGFGPLHIGTDIGGSVRLPAAWCGAFGLKPSLGRIPIDPPYMARAAGPITRTARDAALMMAVLSQPDPRDYSSLPPGAIEWTRLDRDIKGLRIGLLLDAGCGMPVHARVREVVEAAAAMFAAEGAIVELMTPWMTPEIHRGIDTFWRVRSAVDIGALSREKQDKLLPLVRGWAETGRGLSGEAVYLAYQQTVNARSATVAATQPFDYVLSPVSPNTSFPAEWGCPVPDVDSTQAHIGFTVPYSMSEQPAASVCCGYDDNGVPIGLQIAGRRFDDLGVLRMAHAWEAMRPPLRPWPKF